MAKREYSGWIYQVDNDNQYSIIPDVEIEKPKTFFKYYALNKNSVSALTEMYLYASHPNQLNDPFDCNRDLILIDTEEDAKTLWGKLYQPLKDEYEGDLNQILRESNKGFWLLLYKKIGIISLTESTLNPTMWSHYADNHKGFCIELDTDLVGFKHNGPFPMHYTNDIKPIGLSDFGGPLSVLIQTNVKNLEWQYEREWRMLGFSPNGEDFKYYGEKEDIYNVATECERKCSYSTNALKGVYLGEKFFCNQETIDISDNETEIAYKNNKDFGYRIIEFLSNPQLSNIKIFLEKHNHTHLGVISFSQISIIKLCNLRFRISTSQNN